MGSLIKAEGVAKTFGHTQALRSLDFDLVPGQIHALIGENGAGKSTFIKILAGLHDIDGGQLHLDPSLRNGEAIGFIHQDLGIIPGMTVADNVMLGTEYPRRAGLIDKRAVWQQARDNLEPLGTEISPHTVVDDLPGAERTLIAIARALRRNSRVLVLDEPTAVLPGSDVGRLFGVLRRLQQEGLGIIYISHRLGEVLSIADHVTVVRDGVTSYSGETGALKEADLLEFMSGFSASEVTEVRPRSEEVAFRAENVSAHGLQPTTIELRKGEILGCVGLRGAGQECLGQAMFGMIPFEGTMHVEAQPYHPQNPQDALARGVSFISGDRTTTIVSTMTIEENLLINPKYSPDSRWVRRMRDQWELAFETLKRYDVRPPVPTKLIAELSGGNAQKVVFARGLETNPSVVILEDPTAGVDTPTREGIYELMRERSEQGMSFIVMSSDHEEIARVCDRINIFRDGAIVETVEQQPVDSEWLADRVGMEAL